MIKPAKVASHFLDISQEVCPLTFVRTKLLIERMQPGEVAEIRLSGGEPLDNVPRAAREEGHTVTGPQAEDNEDGETSYLLWIERA